jgi:hypothetical protein
MHTKEKKHQCASSEGVQGSPSNARGLKVAGVVCRAKRKHVQKVGSSDHSDANPSSSKKTFENAT